MSFLGLDLRSRINGTVSTLKSEPIELPERLKPWFRLAAITEDDLHAIVDDLGEDEATQALFYKSGLV